MAKQIKKEDLKQMKEDIIMGFYFVPNKSYIKIRYREHDKYYDIKTRLVAVDLEVVSEDDDKIVSIARYGSPAMYNVYEQIKIGKYTPKVGDRFDKWEISGMVGVELLIFLDEQDVLESNLKLCIEPLKKFVATYNKEGKLTEEDRQIRNEAMEEIRQINIKWEVIKEKTALTGLDVI